MAFNFDKLGDSSEEVEANLQKVREKKRLGMELGLWAERNKNPLVFVEYGFENELELGKNIKIKKEILKDLDKDGKEYIENIMENFLSFVAGPVFTDSFHQDSSSREDWKNKHTKELNGKALDYYNSNRLRANINANTTVHFFNEVEEYVHDPYIKNGLNRLKNKMPHEFLDKYENGSGRKVLVYYGLSDEEKIKAVKILTGIIKEAIYLLAGEKSIHKI